jgi:hypothetical protein
MTGVALSTTRIRTLAVILPPSQTSSGTECYEAHATDRLRLGSGCNRHAIASAASARRNRARTRIPRKESLHKRPRGVVKRLPAPPRRKARAALALNSKSLLSAERRSWVAGGRVWGGADASSRGVASSPSRNEPEVARCWPAGTPAIRRATSGISLLSQALGASRLGRVMASTHRLS